MEQFIIALTKWSGPVMVLIQLLLCLGNLYQHKLDPTMYWAGGVLLTVGALRMSGWTI